MRIIKAELEELENYANGTVYGVLLERTGQATSSTATSIPAGNTASTTISSTRRWATWTSAQTSGGTPPKPSGNGCRLRRPPGQGPDAGAAGDSHTPSRGREKGNVPASPRFAGQLRDEASNSQQPAPPEGRSRESSDQ